MTLTKTIDRVRFRSHPETHPEAIITRGYVRFSILTPRLIRMEWAQDGKFEDRATYAFPNRYANPPKYTSRLEGDNLIINTGALQVCWQTSSGPFASNNLSIRFLLNREEIIWNPGIPNPANLRGARRTLDGCAGDASVEEGIISRAGWTLFDDSRSVVFSEQGWVTARSETTRQDWYFFGYGHDYQAALTEYTFFGGNIPLIPKFVLGAWWSRYWAYSADDLKELVENFELHGLPLDVLVIDMDWHTPDGWTGYTWNRQLFPDPPAFLKWVHDKGLKTTLNLHPAEGVQPFEEVYARFASAMGIDPSSHKGIPFRITDPKFVKNYFELLHHPMEDDGVDFWWIDWQQGESSEMKGLDPLTWLNHLHYRDATRRGNRPLIYSRWGGLGNHRYQIGFSGDTLVVWPSLQFQPYFTATGSNVCFGWWTHDIGGHMGGATEPELYARWVQFGALSPVLRLHATKDERAERRPWMYPEPVFQAAKAAFLWRYQLIPYLYSMARIAYDTGIALVRPMYYRYPEAEEAYAARYQYFFGDQMIAAPIVFPADKTTGFAATDVWIPEGQWVDYTTKESYSGPGWVRILGDLNRVPVLMKSGAILPLSTPFTSTKDSLVMASGATRTLPKDSLVLAIFPGEDGKFRLYEDDGETEAFQSGQFEWTEITTHIAQPSNWTVSIAAVEGHCSSLPAARSYTIRLEGSRSPCEVKINGIKTDQWSYNPDTLTTEISIPSSPKNHPINISAIGEDSLIAIGAGHNFQLALADAKQVMGQRIPDSISTLPLFLDYALSQDYPGKVDLVARLGGPLVHFFEFVTEEEASQQLGRVVFGAPHGVGESCDIEIDFALNGRQYPPISYKNVSFPLIINTPFAFDGEMKTQQWEAKVNVSWRGTSYTYAHRSNPLCPGISSWRANLYRRDQAIPAIKDFLLEASQLPAPLNWSTYTEEPRKIENLAYPFHIYPWQDSFQKITAGASIGCCLATTIRSEKAQPANLLFVCNDPADYYLNGEMIARELISTGELGSPYNIHPDMKTAVKVGPLPLRQGENTLVVDIHPIPGKPPSWNIIGLLLSTDGQILTDLSYRTPPGN